MTATAITVTATGPPATGRSSIETLVHPLDLAEFRQRYWQRSPVHLTGWADRFAGLFDRASLARALQRQHELDLSVRVSGDHEGDAGGAAAHIQVDAAEVADQLRAGTSLCVDPVDRADPTVAALAAELRAGLGHLGPISVKCYLSTAGFGFNTHFDAQVVTTVQLEGTKRWRVSPTPGVPFPVDNAFLDESGTIRYNGRTPGSLAAWERPAVDRDAFVEVLLRPGDVLCLPAGTWHEAKAAGGPSLALNFSFSPADVAAVLLELVGPGLREQPGWRAGLSGAEDPVAELRARAEELAVALRSLVDDSPEATRDLTRDGLERLVATSRGRAPARPSASSHAAALEASARTVAVAGRRLQCVLAVSDAAAAAGWYSRVLGGSVVSTIPEFGWVEVSTGTLGVTLGLTEVPTEVANRGAVLDFEVDDLEQIRRLLAENGVQVATPVTEIAGMARVLSAHDLDGNTLMFFESYPPRSPT